MYKLVLIAVATLTLSACNGIQHASCPNDPGSGGQTGVRSVLQTCN